MTLGLLTMSRREIDRLEWMIRIRERRATQAEVATYLDLTVRQVECLYPAFKADGAAALISKKRGRPSARRLPTTTRERILQIVRAQYADFGPTLAHEKLVEQHGVSVSVETLRQWMIAAALWTPGAQRRERPHPARHRRLCLGELVQIDGRNHEWFEERAPRCVLLVYVDDATGRLMQLRFAESESTFAYFDATRGYLLEHGRPVAFYSDTAAVFRVNAKEPCGGDGTTQFARAMGQLNVDVLCANSPQAKGRVERANLTLQDRLVKEHAGIGEERAGAVEARDDVDDRTAGVRPDRTVTAAVRSECVVGRSIATAVAARQRHGGLVTHARSNCRCTCDAHDHCCWMRRRSPKVPQHRSGFDVCAPAGRDFRAAVGKQTKATRESASSAAMSTLS